MATGYWLLAAGNLNRSKGFFSIMRLPEAKGQKPEAIKNNYERKTSNLQRPIGLGQNHIVEPRYGQHP